MTLESWRSQLGREEYGLGMVDGEVTFQGDSSGANLEKEQSVVVPSLSWMM